MAAVPLPTKDPVTVLPEELYETMEPIEGLRVELLDGRLVMSPPPTVGHNQAVWWLVTALFDVARRNGWALLQTTAVHIEATRDRPQPDLVVAAPGTPQYDDHELYAHGVLLVAEVVSPSSGHDDREFKRDLYARGRVPLYLLIDPQQEEKSATLFSDPHPDGYRSRTRVPFGEPITLPEPFGIVLDTGGLTNDL
jgi:Uma2 family endonuclease